MQRICLRPETPEFIFWPILSHIHLIDETKNISDTVWPANVEFPWFQHYLQISGLSY